VAHLSDSDRLAAGLHPPPSLTHPFAAVQAAWRFYANPRVGLGQLAGPLIDCARVDVPLVCDRWLLVVMDWCKLHFGGHESKTDRIELAHAKDLGYDLLTALAVGDRDGAAIAPLCLELRAGDGVHSTRCDRPIKPGSSLDGLEAVMGCVEGYALGKTPVFVIDREADSVGHYRRWHAKGRRFVVRADDARLVLDGRGKQLLLGKLADRLKRQGGLKAVGPAAFKGRSAGVTQFAGETDDVVLHRPARTHRVDKRTGKARHKNISGEPLALRLIVSEIRDDRTGKVLARWLLLTNLPPSSADAATVARWYYWRWRIESYHKLLKGAGQQVESWQQESAAALARRLLVAAMACVLVWRLARDQTPQAAAMRDVLVRLSGRQIKRGTNHRPFTEPALLAGLGVLIPMLDLLRRHDLHDLRRLARATLPAILQTHPPSPRPAREGG
jgi:hypothetical protein